MLASSLLALWLAALPVEPQPAPSGLCTTFRWQYGAESAQVASALLDYPCHHNWIADSYDVPNHTPTAYSLRSSLVDTYIRQIEGAEFWLLGSEPNINSTYIAPDEAAIFVQAWAEQTDNAFACCGTLHYWLAPDMLDWLDAYLAAGGPVPDVWHIHIYFTFTPAQWDATLQQFYEWMERNDVVRPVMVTETAQTYDTGAEALLRHVAQAVCDGDVQAIYWYIGDKDAYGFAPSSQLTVDGAITELGAVFVELQECVVEGEGDIYSLWIPALSVVP